MPLKIAIFGYIYSSNITRDGPNFENWYNNIYEWLLQWGVLTRYTTGNFKGQMSIVALYSDNT